MADTSKGPRIFMRSCRRSFRWLFLPLLALAARPVLSPNLLVNPGFERDLGGWTAAPAIAPNPSPRPGDGEASRDGTASDAAASALSGGAARHGRANTMSFATTTL